MSETEPTCKYYVIRKKRFCRMTVKKGCEYCGEHQPPIENPTNDSNERLRIVCPLDSKHTCYANKLSKHLKKCNANIVNTEAYISKGINSTGDSAIENRALAHVSVPDILAVLKKVDVLYEHHIKNVITQKILSHDELSDELNRLDYGINTRKHLLQNSSLLGHLRDSNLLKSNTCYVEFGAGKGQLSYYISKATENLEKTSVLLVERQSLRHKLDNKLDKSTDRVIRIKADIADLVLNKVETVNRIKNIVGVAKHLCGDATDLALRCILNAQQSGVDVSGILVAFCCHHRCHWLEYIGRSFFEQNNINKYEFDIICGLVSWATCGTGRSRDKRLNPETNNDARQLENDRNVGFTLEEKETAGKKCKLLLDFGRLKCLQQNGFRCSLYYYVEQKVSLENVCILANKS